MVSYYDWLLAAIAAATVVGAATSVHPAVAIHQGLAGGSLVSTLILYEILFRNPPTEPTRSPTAASVAVGVGWLLTVVLMY
ncbi:MAG: hypothetical protein R6U01_04035 [Halorubrum sp.]|uniref:hypothetical protein n=1 Tax=Halorubrum sp. TaxID=1879286 RepID=UPI0039704C82